MRPVRFAAFVAVSVVSAGLAHAEPAPVALVLNHEGRLLDGDEKPVSGSVSLRIRIWDGDGSSARAVFDETYDVRVSQGGYALAIGDTAGDKKALTVDHFAGPRWLSVTVGPTELQPRLRVGTVPASAFATKAGDSDKIAGLTLSDLDARFAPASGGGYAQLNPSAPQSGGLKLTGSVTANAFVGDGSAITGLTFAGIEGKLETSRLTGNLDVARVTGAIDFARIDGSLDIGRVEGALPSSRLDGTIAANLLPLASGSSAGAITSADKTKLDSVTAGAAVAAVTATAPIKATTGNSPVLSISPATPSAAGSMSAADKTKLDGLAPGVIPVLADRPTNPVAGTIFFNSSTLALDVFDGTSWRGLGGVYANCKAIMDAGASRGDGVYRIRPDPTQSDFETFCDMTTAGGGWTLVSSVVDGDVLRSADSADQKWQLTGTNRWADTSQFGALTTATRTSNGDYKNGAYSVGSYKNLLVYHTPNDAAVSTFHSAAIYAYYTTNDFLGANGGNLYKLYKDFYPLTRGSGAAQGLKVDVTYAIGSAAALHGEQMPNNRGESTAGGITIYTRNNEGTPIAFCPVKYNGVNSEHSCIGGDGSTNGRGAGGWGNFREWAYDTTWGFSARMRTATVLFFVR